MALFLGVAFFVVPFVEMLVIFAIGPRIGWDTTVTLLVLMSAAGAWLVKREGLGTWRRIQEGLQVGRMPTTDVVDGFLVLTSGVLLLCPGFVTSALGIILILPPVRTLMRGVAGDALRNRVARRIRTVGSRLNDGPAAPTFGAGAGPARSYSRADDGGFHQQTFDGPGFRPAGNGSHTQAPPDPERRAYRRPDEPAPESARVWGARVRRDPIDDLDVIDVDGEEMVFGQNEIGPTGF